jgi:hypothetical protein
MTNMASDAEQLRLIRAQALALAAQITAAPKPSYEIDGQSMSWNEYLGRLEELVDWCDRKLSADEPCEFRTQAVT